MSSTCLWNFVHEKFVILLKTRVLKKLQTAYLIIPHNGFFVELSSYKPDRLRQRHTNNNRNNIDEQEYRLPEHNFTHGGVQTHIRSPLPSRTVWLIRYSQKKHRFKGG